MNTAMRLLARLSGFQEEAGTEEASGAGGAGADFKPQNPDFQQTEGIFDRKSAEAKQAEDDASDLETKNDGDVATTLPIETKSEDDAEGEPKSDDEGEKDAEVQLTYKGVPVEIENKPEMVEAFKEKGLDIDAVNAELFSESGLTQETLDKLYEAFGEIPVDMYLDSWERKAEADMQAFNAQDTADTAKDQLREVALKSIAGDNVDAVFKWANDNLGSEDYKKYEAVINGDDDFAMKMAFRELKGLSGIDAKIVPAKRSAREVGSTAVNKAPAPTTLTSAEYKALFVPDGKTGKAKYWDDPSKFDAMLEAGKK